MQHVNIASLEIVISHLLNKAEEALATAKASAGIEVSARAQLKMLCLPIVSHSSGELRAVECRNHIDRESCELSTVQCRNTTVKINVEIEIESSVEPTCVAAAP